MPNDKITADIVGLEQDDDRAILSAAWEVPEASAKARAVFSGVRRQNAWDGEMAVYVDGVTQPVFTGKFSARRATSN